VSSLPARTGADSSGIPRVGSLVRRHPLITFLAIFNTFGQALAFVPVIARSVYGVELDREVILIVATVLFLFCPPW